MVAAQVYLALCVAGVAVAAPQLDFGGLRSVTTTREVATNNVDEAQVVSSVVSALQPSIAQAVADALAGLRTTSITSTSTSSKSSLAAANAAAAQKAAVASADVGPVAKAEYNFEYKVADNDAQTYISQSEDRDGDSLTGTYSYVNPVGSLITVEYQAGPEGYTQTSSEQAGFVQIRAKQDNGAAAAEAARLAAEQRARAQAEQRARAEAARIAAEQRARAEAARIAAEQRAAEEAARIAAEQRAAEEAARLAAEQAAAQQALISRIISSIQPQIGSAVQSAISSSQTVVAPAPVARVIPVAATGDVSTTFGNGFSVKIDTPE